MMRGPRADFRVRAVAAIDDDFSQRQAARRFRIGMSLAWAWYRQPWRGKSRKQDKPCRSKLDVHETFILVVIKDGLDITFAENVASCSGARCAGSAPISCTAAQSGSMASPISTLRGWFSSTVRRIRNRSCETISRQTLHPRRWAAMHGRMPYGERYRQVLTPELCPGTTLGHGQFAIPQGQQFAKGHRRPEPVSCSRRHTPQTST